MLTKKTRIPFIIVMVCLTWLFILMVMQSQIESREKKEKMNLPTTAEILNTYNWDNEGLDAFQVRLKNNMADYVAACMIQKSNQFDEPMKDPMQIRDLFEQKCFMQFQTTVLAGHARPKREIPALSKQLGMVEYSQKEIEAILKQALSNSPEMQKLNSN